VNVTGGSNSEYSLYVDLTYADGSLIGSAPERDGANWRISLGAEEVAV
jgi:hypothetical protein